MNIQEIKIDKLPVIIISDSHCNLSNIKKLKELYPNNQFICLGDICFLFAKAGEPYNKHSINYFIENKIPCLKGNHEEHIINCAESDSGNSLIIFKAIPRFDEHSSLFDNYGLDKNHLNYLKSLPIGFKIILPNGENYLAYHNKPKELWSFTENLSEKSFLEVYNPDNKCRGIIIGHHHYPLKIKYSKREMIYLGRLSVDGDYGLLYNNHIELKKL